MRIFRHVFSQYTGRQRLCLCLGAAIYAVLFALGSQIDQQGCTALSTSLARFALAFPAALGALILLFGLLDCLRCTAESNSVHREIRDTAAAFCILFFCYAPMFMIQYPGSFTYDILPQSLQAASGNYNTFHPLLHTLFLKACISCSSWLNSFERAAALCSVIQMVIVSWCFSTVCAIIRRCFSRKAYWTSLAFFCLYPAHMAFASTFTKDVMFSAFFALFVTLAFEDVQRGSLSMYHRLILVISGVLACLLRNNMIYALAMWVVFLLLSRKRLRHLALCALAVFILSKGADALLVSLTHAQDGPLREMFSIPAQQFARVRLYAKDSLTPQECAQMDTFFDQVTYELYDPTIADPIKNRIDDQAIKDRPGEALSLWLSLGRQYPGLYLDAFLNTALPSLYPYSHYQVSAQYIEIGECRIGLTMPYALEQLVQPGRFAKLRHILNEQIYNTGADHHPLARWFFNTGFIFWLLLLQLLYDLYAGNYTRFAVMILPVLLWGTYLLGPVMQGRYLYPFICILPLFFLRPRQPD